MPGILQRNFLFVIVAAFLVTAYAVLPKSSTKAVAISLPAAQQIVQVQTVGMEDLIFQSKPVPPPATFPDYGNGGKVLQPVPQSPDLGHVLKDGDASRIAERLLVASGLASLISQGRPPECWYRQGGGQIPDKGVTIDAAVAIVFKGPGITLRSGGATFQGVMALLNLDNPSRSTALAGLNTLKGVYQDGSSMYVQLPMTDARCSWGMQMLMRILDLLRKGGSLPPPPAFAG